jgi:peptidoglycan/xylan/chitin deacetylase (PgdA/CDA1 family)
MAAGSRDIVGYGAHSPTLPWPGGAKLAISLVVNYEEGSERSFASGDPDQEPLTEWGSYPLPPDIRNLAMESMFEYGSRVGVWRILDVLARHNVPATFFACAVAFEQAPDVAKAAVAAGHEICSHGYRWEEVFRLSEEEEREHIRRAVESLERTTGQRPRGWYCRYGPSERTRALIVEEGGFSYDSDAYNDDVPYFVDVKDHRHLVVPYTADNNDFRFWQANGPTTHGQFLEYLKDSFDVLYDEARTHPKMMSVGLHCRMIGRPGRIGALDKFIAYAKGFPEVWFATRAEIAQWWLDNHPEPGPRLDDSKMALARRNGAR